MHPRPSMIEPLEARIAPAAILTYFDMDGDLVKITSSKGKAADLLAAAHFDGTGHQLQMLDLKSMVFAGTTISITAKPQPEGGNGIVNVGWIDATGFDLGGVTIAGDLGKIEAGDATTKTPGLKALNVQSLGASGTATGAPDLVSHVAGKLGKIAVKGSIVDASVNITGGDDGKLGSLTVGVSMTNGVAGGGAVIHSTGDMGAVKITKDLSGIYADSAAILSDGKIASVKVGGSVLGGGARSGLIKSGKDLGKVTITGDLSGGLGDPSGAIVSGGKLAGVYIGGSLRGGIILIPNNPMQHNGYISSVGDMGQITIKHDLIGGINPASGLIASGGKLTGVSIGGSLFGGAGAESGRITSVEKIGTIKITVELTGGSIGLNTTATSSGTIETPADIGTVRIGTNLSGGSANKSGMISAHQIGTLKIGGNLYGANSLGRYSFADSAVIAAEAIGTLSIGGFMSGGSAGNETLTRTGYITATTIKALSIKLDLTGGGVSGSGAVQDSGVISAGHIGKITVGSIAAGSKGTQATGTLGRTGSIRVEHEIGSLTVKGDVAGTQGIGLVAVPVVISAGGQATPGKTKDVAIGSITITGDVKLTNIFAGYDQNLVPVNGDAQIGAVKVTGGWTTANLIAGAKNTASGNVNFGDANDASIGAGSDRILARIASISIGREVTGTAGGTEHYGFVAQQIGSFKSGGVRLPLLPAPSTRPIGDSGDVSIHLL
jgi:hypothetical protein